MQEMAAKSDVLFVLPDVIIMHCCQSVKCVFVKKHLTFFIKRAIMNLEQYRTKIVRQMRRQIFRQMKQKAE